MDDNVEWTTEHGLTIPIHSIPLGTYVFHSVCEQTTHGVPSAIVNETKDYGKMVFCFNCGLSTFIVETFRPEQILYGPEEIVTINEHIVHNESLIDLPQKWVIVDAPTGSGKTKLIADDIKRHHRKSVLAVAPYVALVKNLAMRFDLDIYSNEQFNPTPRYACTVNHLERFNDTHEWVIRLILF